MPSRSAFEALKPFAWLALASFFVGVLSYLVIGVGSRADHRAPAPYVDAATASAPASTSGAWNLPKHI